MMDRRAFIGSLALGSLVPRVTHAQTARKVYRIGMLGLGPTSRVRELRELGFVYGEQFVTEPRGAEGRPERYPILAAELVHLQVDVIVAAGPALPALGSRRARPRARRGSCATTSAGRRPGTSSAAASRSAPSLTATTS